MPVLSVSLKPDCFESLYLSSYSRNILNYCSNIFPLFKALENIFNKIYLLVGSVFMSKCFCASDISFRIICFMDTPKVQHTVAVISRGSIIGTANPTPAMITPTEMSVVSTLSVIVIPRLYFLL